MPKVTCAYSVLLFVTGISIFVAFFTNSNKKRVFHAAIILIWIHLIAIFFLFYLLELQYHPVAGFLATLGWGALMYVNFYYCFLLEFDDGESDWFYNLSSPVVSCFLIACLLGQLVFKKYYEPEFLTGATIVGLLHYLTRKHEQNYALFQFSAIFVTFLYLLLFLVHPLLYGADFHDYPRAIFVSLALNAGFAVFPYCFFMGNLRNKGLVNNIDMKATFRLVFFCSFGAMLYKDPIAHDFVNRLPIFKELLPGASSAVAFFYPAIVAILKSTKARI